jgi:hypothetical protein
MSSTVRVILGYTDGVEENQKQDDLLEAAKTVLQMNDRGIFTVPTSVGLYPHQWLWDSCFIAIGLRHYDLERAKVELLSLLRGQWANGMLPNVIHSSAHKHHRDDNIWRSWLNPNAPDSVSTSGITQPPLLAEAIVRLGEKMDKAERRTWYQTVFPALLAYHQWLYNERDPHSEGLVLQVHPWETGLDNTPPWMSELHEHQLALWIQIVKKLKLSFIFNLFRNDTRYIPAEQRMSTVDGLALYSTQRRLRRKGYDIKKILSHSLFAIEDVSFNAIFIRANQHLMRIAKTLRRELPPELIKSMEKTEKAFEQLWDPYSSQYYSREFVTHRLLKVPSIGTLMPLYAGSITKERAEELVRLLEDEHQFGANFPVPSTPLNCDWFKANCYWQGPSWVNMNWLIIDGLKRYGFDDHAAALTETTLDMIKRSGFAEYFSPINGSASGAENFSWTASLTIDLLSK